MYDRRRFLQTSLAAVAATSVLATPSARAESPSLPGGVVYSADHPGKWEKKVGSHAPQVTVEGDQVTVKTDHIMTEKHYIVRHTVVDAEGNVVGEKTFYPEDEEAVSNFKMSGKGTFLATSFCNKHDLWVTSFTV